MKFINIPLLNFLSTNRDKITKPKPQNKTKNREKLIKLNMDSSINSWTENIIFKLVVDDNKVAQKLNTYLSKTWNHWPEITQLDHGKTAERVTSKPTLFQLHPMPFSEESLALTRYWARLILATEPVIVTSLLEEPSIGLAILMWWISLMLAPWCPTMQEN